jgi:lysozyme
MSIADKLRSEEGFKPYAYQDTLGYWTVGYGFLIDPNKGDGLPKEVADFWLDFLIEKIDNAIRIKWTSYISQPKDVQDALVEMAYQLGIDGLLEFKLMLMALERGDRETAADNALDSRWHAQTPARCERVAAIIRGEAT